MTFWAILAVFLVVVLIVLCFFTCAETRAVTNVLTRAMELMRDGDLTHVEFEEIITVLKHIYTEKGIQQISNSLQNNESEEES